jgi:hypothetical protein
MTSITIKKLPSYNNILSLMPKDLSILSDIVLAKQYAKCLAVVSIQSKTHKITEEQEYKLTGRKNTYAIGIVIENCKFYSNILQNEMKKRFLDISVFIELGL